jgi:WD40 repeat protein
VCSTNAQYPEADSLSAAFLPGDARYAVVSHIDGRVYKLDLRTRAKVDQFLGHCNSFHTQLHPTLVGDGQLLAALGADCRLRVWNVARAGASAYLRLSWAPCTITHELGSRGLFGSVGVPTRPAG